ncbi:hypothetical protein GUITHDRAFT_101717 [Guillardia theta CCMP2712]|uniref:Magnesium transporter n=1 Tax=Guillardia theta (strain CCMP2712) TaxID=905079 RepID=L1JWH0_GUITC|nr:hypothetical protein GUITHDRAFT_101717 [Guillardia theta CCMP2712]EKX52550.1 hypothetical protein GUITHDRAFT_101717 [Guillardia theta CCMP2712]|eukprot:XP_005839530.1 hypothetical protein GUITHDRAFT_101717 [Guillardia theta CCMP2712]
MAIEEVGERGGLRGRMAGKLRALKKRMQADRMSMPFQQQTSLDVLQRLLEQRGRENEFMEVLQLFPDLTLSEKLQMNRHSLLAECKRFVREFSYNKDSSRSELLRHANSRNHGGDVLRSHLQDLSPDLSQKLEGSRSHSTPTGLHTGTGSSHTSRSISRENRSKSQDPEKEAANRTAPLGSVLQLRDVRTLLCVAEPTLLIRRGVFVISFSSIRALITCKKAIFVFPDGDDTQLIHLLAKLREEPQDKQVNLPFELKVLEAILLVFVQVHTTAVDSCSQDCKVQLKSLKSAVTASMLNEMYVLKTRVAQAVQQVQVAKDELERVQKDDQLMALMNLTEMYNDTESYTDHIEVLLDTYAYELGNLNSRLTRIIKQIDATEDLLNLRLENVQKNTFIANAFFHMILSFLGFPTAIAGIFGMNLWSGLKFDLSGPMNKGVNFTPPFYPVDQYDNDKNLGMQA